MEDEGFAPWLLGLMMGIMSLLGLFLASAASDRVFYAAGLIFFLFGVLMIFGLIARYVGGPRSAILTCARCGSAASPAARGHRLCPVNRMKHPAFNLGLDTAV